MLTVDERRAEELSLERVLMPRDPSCRATSSRIYRRRRRVPAFEIVGGCRVSTRTQLRFVQRIDYENDDGVPETTERVAQVYRHSDGYPASVLPDLKRLKMLLALTASERGPGYAAAQFIFLDKLRSMGCYIGTDPERSIRVSAPEALTDPASFEHLHQPQFLLGHGVENPSEGIHGDEEYLYVVEVPRHETFGEPGEWTVKVSDHCGFPRWDGPTELAFERATWQYEGSLEQSIFEFGIMA